MAKIMLPLLAFIGVFGLGVQAADPKCWVGVPEALLPKNLPDWRDMEDYCLNNVTAHIKNELGASMTYLAMGAHFLSSHNFRPGVAKLFMKHAGEEREHARALIEYVIMRGYEIKEDVIPALKPKATTWSSVAEALTDTLTIEKQVRDNFKDIILACEGGAEHSHNDYHISDFLTGVFLDEQHKGVHEIANLLAQLHRLLQSNVDKNPKYTAFAEFEFDNMLLAKE